MDRKKLDWVDHLDEDVEVWGKVFHEKRQVLEGGQHLTTLGIAALSDAAEKSGCVRLALKITCAFRLLL